MLKAVGRREILGILVLFLIVQAGGLFIAEEVYLSNGLGLVEKAITGNNSVLLSYAVDIVLGVVLLLLLVNRIMKNSEPLDHYLFVVFESAVIMITSFFATLFFLIGILPKSYSAYYFVLGLAIALLVIVIRRTDPNARNIATIVSSIGVGLVLGLSFTFYYVLAILAIVATYDYISVFITKTMIKLANKLSDEDVAFLIDEEDVEGVPESELTPEERKEEELEREEDGKDPFFRKILQIGEVPMLSRIQLGEGDLGLPLMAAVSAFYTFHLPFLPLLMIVCGSGGIFITMLFLKKYGMALPAIPPLFASILIASGIGLLLTGRIDLYYSFFFLCGGAVIMLVGMNYELYRKNRKMLQKKAAGIRVSVE